MEPTGWSPPTVTDSLELTSTNASDDTADRGHTTASKVAVPASFGGGEASTAVRTAIFEPGPRTQEYEDEDMDQEAIMAAIAIDELDK